MSYVVVNPVEQRAFEFGSPVVVPTPREEMGAQIDELIGRFSRAPRRPPKRAAVLIETPQGEGMQYEYSKRWKPGGPGKGKFFDGTRWVSLSTMRRRARKGVKRPASRRRRGARDARGRFLPARKRKAASRRAPARRAAPKRRAAARRPRLGRDSRGRFLKRGSTARRRRRGGGHLRPITRKSVAAARRRKGVKKHMRARRTIRRGQRIAGLVRINPRTGAIIMSRAKVANPRRRRKNPRRHHRARNPGGSLMSTAKAAIVPMLAGTGAGMVSGFVDAKFLATRPTVSVASKVVMGILGALALRKKHPAAAMGFAGGMLGATGYSYGVKFGGGHVALNGMQGLRGLADMAADDPETANLIAGLADVVPDGGMGDADEYQAALGDDDDQMGDIVED